MRPVAIQSRSDSGSSLVWLWIIWIMVFIIVILADVSQFMKDPNWVEYATLGGGIFLVLITVGNWARTKWELWQTFDIRCASGTYGSSGPTTKRVRIQCGDRRTLLIRVKVKYAMKIERFNICLVRRYLIPVRRAKSRFGFVASLDDVGLKQEMASTIRPELAKLLPQFIEQYDQEGGYDGNGHRRSGRLPLEITQRVPDKEDSQL